ncbi:hypothetical protein [Natrinema versiforme]|uniref:hypothetical protein n=1 Tax=Natrinema versiforme TaxID=88724 RepID=UPI000AD7C18D|nr:hypothetical protein [Natrinema versiforme]
MNPSVNGSSGEGVSESVSIAVDWSDSVTITVDGSSVAHPVVVAPDLGSVTSA